MGKMVVCMAGCTGGEMVVCMTGCTGVGGIVYITACTGLGEMYGRMYRCGEMVAYASFFCSIR